MRIVVKLLFACTALIITSCGGKKDSKKAENTINLRFVDEYVLPAESALNSTKVGGLSSIDYANGSYYLISDNTESPRFYQAEISFDLNGFDSIFMKSVTLLKDKNGLGFSEGSIDPESLRYDNGSFIWTSEGNINNGVNPFVRISDSSGKFVKEIDVRDRFLIHPDPKFGPRHNGVFESITLSHQQKGYWAAMELPLKQDGDEPTLDETDSPVRIAFINKETGSFEKEIVYELDNVTRQAINGHSFELNGVVEILEYDTNKFLVLERSYAMGYKDGGNTVKIYDVDASNATDVSNFKSLKVRNYSKATKKLLYNFDTIRNDLTNGVVDNIEGITFGPNFENGNRSLIVVADNNFNLYGSQLNQFILFEFGK
ncbi:esterase-like activity of phytase family protein [Maribacter sp. HS]|uniref:esterase-like activity of phytase family protein n=1 Tax=Maribacter sp. HS TaxID=3110480 RepID=UPI003A83D0F5